MSKIQKLRESIAHFKGRKSSEITVLVFPDKTFIICDGRKRLLAEPEREMELKASAERIPVESVKEARIYLAAALNCGWLGLEGGDRTRYINGLAEDYVSVLNISIHDLVRELSEDIGMSPQKVRTHLDSKYKLMSRTKQSLMRTLGSHDKKLTPYEDFLLKNEMGGKSGLSTLSKRENMEYLLNLLDNEEIKFTVEEQSLLLELRDVLVRRYGAT